MSSTIINAPHQLLVAKFGAAVLAADGAASVWFSTDDGAWHARAETPEGILFLETPDGGGFGLETLLSVLSGVGVTRIMVEFNGLPPLYYDRVN